MYELEQIDSFFRANHLSKDLGINGFTLINDNLFFSFNNDITGVPASLHYQPDAGSPIISKTTTPGTDPAPVYVPVTTPLRPLASEVFSKGQLALIGSSDQAPRYNGTVMYALLDYSNVLGYARDGGYSNQFSTGFSSPAVQLGIEKHTAVSMHWQRIISANAWYFRCPEVNGLLYSKENRVSIAPRLGLAYYPNNHSSFEANILGEALYLQSPAEKGNWHVYPALFFAASKFVNYNTLFKLDVNFEGPVKGTFSAGVTVHLRHYFF